MQYLTRLILPYIIRGLRAWRWWGRGLILLVLMSMLAAPRARVILDPPQTVASARDHICVHTRLIDEVEEWVIQRSLQLVREMGADTIVEFFPWAYIEHQPGQYGWGQADMIMRHADNQGLRVIARMGFVPAWAQPDRDDEATTLNELPPESYDAFADFVATFAQRYEENIAHIIIWNEPNLAFEWGYQDVTAADYVRLLETVYPRVKAVTPDVTIMAGALAPTLEPAGSRIGLNDLSYLEQMYQAGAADYFDALAIHTYGFTEPARAEPHPDVLNFRRAELLYEIVRQYDDPDTPVYITESGWNDNPRWTKAVRPSQRIAYTLDAFAYAEQNWEWLEDLCIWVFRYPTPTFSYPDNFTLVSVDFQLKPIYHAIQAYARDEERRDALWLSPPTATD